MIVIYAEKASLAKAIAVALKAGNRIAHQKEPTIGHYEFIFNGEKAVLCHGVGHLCGLVDVKAYGEQYAVWNTDNYPCIPDSYQIAVKTDTKTCFDYVKVFFDKADLIINATDPDREGELIFAYIYEAMHCTKPWKRVWIEDLTPQKIQYAFAHLKDSSEVISIQQAGRARSIADWICGINLTVAATRKYCTNQKDKGLGTPATRARIINALFENGYLTKNKKYVIPTEKGKFLIEHLPVEELKSPEMTGQWEKRLHDITDGKEDYLLS